MGPPLFFSLRPAAGAGEGESGGGNCKFCKIL